MKILNLFKKKCFFCKNVEENNKILTHSKLNKTIKIHMRNCGMYQEEISCYYHDDCLKQVLNNPETFPNKILDMAIDISDKNKYDEKKRADKISRIKDLH